jgi:hypothetical protein
MGDFEYDDGLVHGHLWASETLARPQPRRENPQRTDISARTDDGYDDGLVHNHGWARNF